MISLSTAGYDLLDHTDTIVLAAMLGAVVVAVVIAAVFSEIHRRRASQRSFTLENVAKRHGWEYQQANTEVSKAMVKVLQPSTVVNYGLPYVNKFRPVDLTDFVFLPNTGIVVCDCARWMTSRKSGGSQFATILYACANNVSLPHFGLLPKTLGDRIASGVGLPGSQAVNHRLFDQRYRVHGCVADKPQRLLCPEGLDLVARRKNFLVEGWEQHVVVAYSPLLTNEQSFFASANDRRIGLEQEKHFVEFVRDAASLTQLIFEQASLHPDCSAEPETS